MGKKNEGNVSALAEAEGYRDTFREAAERARASTGVDEAFVTRIEARFATIEQEISEAKNDVVIQNLVDRCEELERLRAYLYPAQRLRSRHKHTLPTCGTGMSRLRSSARSTTT